MFAMSGSADIVRESVPKLGDSVTSGTISGDLDDALLDEGGSGLELAGEGFVGAMGVEDLVRKMEAAFTSAMDILALGWRATAWNGFFDYCSDVGCGGGDFVAAESFLLEGEN